MKRKIIPTLLLTALAGLSLASCGDDSGTSGNGEIFVDQEWELYEEGHTVTAPTEISFWSANSAVDLHGRVMAEMVQEFNNYQKTTYPDSYIKVNVSFQGGYSTQNTKLQAALIGGTNPEIAMVGVSSMALYRDNAIDQREIFTYDQLRDVYEGFLQFAMYKHRFVAYPYFASTNCLVVNRDIVDKTGLDIPTMEEIVADPENSTWTWDLFYEYLEKSRDVENGIYGLSFTGIPIYESYYSYGVPVYNETCDTALIDSEQGLEIFTYWQNAVKNDLIENPVLDPNHGTQIQAEFTTGATGMYSATSAVIKSLYEIVVTTPQELGREPLFEMDVLPFPKKTNFYANQSGGGLIVFNNHSDQKTKAAVEFLRWLQAPEQSAKYSTETGYLVTTHAATQTQTWIDYKEINPLLDRTIQMMSLTPPEDVKVPVGRAKALADTDFTNYSKGIFYDLNANPLDILKECQERINYVLKSNS